MAGDNLPAKFHLDPFSRFAGIYVSVQFGAKRRGGPVPSLPALGHWAPPPNRTGPLARKYLPGFPYSWSLRRLRQKISSIYCTVICNYPSAAQEQPFTVSLLCITKTGKLCWPDYALLVFVQSCSSINDKIISFKKLFHHSQLGPLKKKKKSGALGMMKISYGRVQTSIALLIWAQSTSVTNGQTDMPFRGVAGWKYVGWTDIGERGGWAYNWGLGAEPPAGSGAEPLVRESGGRSPPEAENLLASGCATEAANLPHSPQFANSVNPRHSWYIFKNGKSRSRWHVQCCVW